MVHVEVDARHMPHVQVRHMPHVQVRHAMHSCVGGVTHCVRRRVGGVVHTMHSCVGGVPQVQMRHVEVEVGVEVPSPPQGVLVGRNLLIGRE